MRLSISTTRLETLLGSVYLPFSLFLLPNIIGIVGYILGFSLSLAVVNILYFILNFICIIAIFYRFLWHSLKAATNNIWRWLRYATLGFGMYYLLSILVSFVILRISPEFSNVNDGVIANMAETHGKLISFCSIFLVPVVEETLYRGLVFQRLQRKNRPLAYCVSCVVFSLIHITGYIGMTDWMTLLLCFVQYLPAGIAFAWAYEKADTIFAPILIHITINQIGMSVLR